MKKIKIGNIKLKNPLILAPMVDVTDLPYRLICRKNGAALAYTEMTHALEIYHKKEVSKKIKTIKKDKPLGIQITASTVKQIEKILPVLKKNYQKDFDLVDLNCGCPSDRTIYVKSGSFLLTEPKIVGQMIKTLKNAGLPTTVKIRLGFNKNNVLKLTKEIEKAGADALTIHARLATQSYKIPADWKQIKSVSKNIGIPLIGNGDIFNPRDAEKMLEITDMAMIGRAAIGNPLIFRNILYYLQTGKEKKLDFKQNLRQFEEYLKSSKKYGTINMKKTKYLGANFIKNVEGAAKLRQEFMELKTLKEVERFVKHLLN